MTKQMRAIEMLRRNASTTACQKADTRAVSEAQWAVGTSLRCVLLVEIDDVSYVLTYAENRHSAS